MVLDLGELLNVDLDLFCKDHPFKQGTPSRLEGRRKLQKPTNHVEEEGVELTAPSGRLAG